jgi:hypothetical protein
MKFWHASCVLEIFMIIIYFVLKCKIVLVNTIKVYGVEVQRYSFLASTLTISEWPALGPSRLNLRMDMP